MLKKVNLLVLIIFFLGSISLSAQNVRGFYSVGIGSWLGNNNVETDILEYAQGNGYNYINFYDLPDIDWSNPSDMNKLASFMNRGRTLYGVTEFGAIVETYDFFINYIIPYNNSRSNINEKFDIINLEFEFWVNSSINNLYCNTFLAPNGYSCDTSGAMKFAWKQFKLIDSVCAVLGLTSEMYLGWPNEGQMRKYASIADRLFLHAYRPTDNDLYSYSKNRLKMIGTLNTNVKVIPLFSGESAFMGPWLQTHPITRPYQTYASDLAAETQSFKQYIDLTGYHWFTYDDMPKTMLGTASISANGPLTFCTGDSVTLTANSGSSYLWSPGGQTTQSINASTSGSYTVRVTNSNGVSVVSFPTVVTVTNSSTLPTVSVTGTTSFCIGDSAILTADQASSYLWSTGDTTQSITVSLAGTYTVTAGSGNCVATSLPVNINVHTPPAAPSVYANGPLTFCQGKQLILSSTSSNNYLWSNGATTRSIIVNAAGTYTVSTFSGPNCSASSPVTVVNLLNSPSVPSITPGGSTTLGTSNLTVVLTSSPAYLYLWTDGSTTQSITVSTQGSYIVTAIDANGCESSSAPLTVTGSGCVPPATPVITLSGSNTIPPGGSVILSTSVASGYLWSTGETTRSILVSDSGSYTVTIYNGPSCSSTSMPVDIYIQSIALGSNDLINGNSDYNVFPNPFTSSLNVNFMMNQTEEVNFRLTDLTGREVFSQNINAFSGQNHFLIDAAGLTRGVYFAWLTVDGNKRSLKVFAE